MQRTAVRSRDIAIVGFDEENSMLEVAFRSGSVYLYKDVPQDKYQAFMKAESHGSFFRQEIRDQYLYEKLT